MNRSGGSGTVPRGSGGFSLVEAMFALVLLCSGLLAAAALMSVAVRGWHRAGQMSVAVRAVAEIADSFGVFGVSGGGSREYGWGSVVWDAPIPTGTLMEVELRASARASTAELLRVVTTVRNR